MPKNISIDHKLSKWGKNIMIAFIISWAIAFITFRLGLIFELFKKLGLIGVVHCDSKPPQSLDIGENNPPSQSIGSGNTGSNVNINVAPNSSNSSNNNVSDPHKVIIIQSSKNENIEQLTFIKPKPLIK